MRFDRTTSLFFEQIEVALGNRECLSENPSEKEWQEMLAIAKSQAVVGITFDTLKKLNQYGQKPPIPLLYEWIGLSEQIKFQNILINKRCVEITNILSESGFETCILKGQGNAMMYPKPLTRQPGDIDIWINADRDRIISFVKRKYPHEKVTALHIDYPIFNDVSIELHFIPTCSITIRHQKALSQYLKEQRKIQFNNTISLSGIDSKITIPTNEFNVVYQLQHMQRHFFKGGIGLKQLIDFYYLLLFINSCKQSFNTDKVKKTISEQGLKRFASGIMWVLKDFLKISDDLLFMEPDYRRGRIIIDEMLKTGSFGQYDHRRYKKYIRYSATLSMIIRNINLIRSVPEESISAPIYGLYRKIANKKIE